jgi:CRP/FNR family transcriptional regulator, cyclic AMP receptor protein
MMNTVPELEPCPLLRNLDTSQLADVFELVEAEQFHAGEEILEQGKVFQAIWMIVSGECEVVRSCGHNRTRQLAVLDAGGVFGEMSFFQKAPHSANVRALTDVDTVRISPEAFLSLKQCNLAAAYGITANLVHLLSDRLRRMDTWTCDLVEQTEDDRRHDEWQEFQSKLYTDWTF